MEPLQIESITTQGDPSSDKNYVPTFTVQYTEDNETWINVTDDGENHVVSNVFLSTSLLMFPHRN